MYPVHLKELLQHRFLGPVPKVSGSVRSGSRIRVSDKSPGVADAAGLGTVL